MTLKEQIIWTVLGIDDHRTLQQLLHLAEKYRAQKTMAPQDAAHDPTSFLPSFSNLQVITVDEALSPDYAYSRASKAAIVGQWPGDESVEELLQMLNR